MLRLYEQIKDSGQEVRVLHRRCFGAQRSGALHLTFGRFFPFSIDTSSGKTANALMSVISNGSTIPAACENVAKYLQ